MSKSAIVSESFLMTCKEIYLQWNWRKIILQGIQKKRKIIPLPLQNLYQLHILLIVCSDAKTTISSLLVILQQRNILELSVWISLILWGLYGGVFCFTQPAQTHTLAHTAHTHKDVQWVAFRQKLCSVLKITKLMYTMTLKWTIVAKRGCKIYSRTLA